MGSEAKAILEERLHEPRVDERRQLIDRVASSTQLRRSARLRDFLLYVGAESLKEGRPEVHEQEIGAKVFGRAPSYDRSQDNIVRVNATELRKRIELYFATDGAHETLVLEIPRGGYKPVFRRRIPDDLPQPTPLVELPPAEDLPKPPPAVSVQTSPDRAPLLWAGLAVALAILCAVLYQQNRALRSSSAPWAGRPEVETFWKDFVKGQQQIDIVLPDASVTLSEELTHRRMLLSDYLNHDYLSQQKTSSLSPDRVSDLHDIFGHNLVTLGDFHAAQQILALTPLAPSLRLVLSRYYTADSIQQNSFILLGGRKANPWMGLLEDRMNFSVDFGPHEETFVTNRHPQAGEQSSYAARTDPSGSTTVYSVIAYLPNLSHTGNVIVLAGTDSSATSAAAEFLTSEAPLARFRSVLHTQKYPYFEVLLKSSRVSGTLFSSEMVAYRTYPATR